MYLIKKKFSMTLEGNKRWSGSKLLHGPSTAHDCYSRKLTIWIGRLDASSVEHLYPEDVLDEVAFGSQLSVRRLRLLLLDLILLPTKRTMRIRLSRILALRWFPHSIPTQSQLLSLRQFVTEIAFVAFTIHFRHLRIWLISVWFSVSITGGHSRIIHGDEPLRFAFADVEPVDELFVDLRVNGVHRQALVVAVYELYQCVNEAADGGEIFSFFL